MLFSMKRTATPRNTEAARTVTASDRLISLPDVRARAANISRTTVWRLVRDGEFPQPVNIGGRTVFSEREVNDWIAKRLESRHVGI